MRLGVPRSVFLGRVVAPGEPLFLVSDAEAVLAYLAEESVRCPGCGHPREETMEQEAEGAFGARAMRCHACAARDRKARQFAADDRGGLYFAAERIR